MLLLLFHVLYLCLFINYKHDEVSYMELDCCSVDPVPWPYSVHVGVRA